MDPILTKNAPKPIGPYSQAIKHQGMIYVSGQLPIDPMQPEIKLKTIEVQTAQVLNNIDQILLAAGSDRQKVIKTTIYLSDMRLFKKVNDVYAQFFGDHQPARATVPINELPNGYLIEIDAIAAE